MWELERNDAGSVGLRRLSEGSVAARRSNPCPPSIARGVALTSALTYATLKKCLAQSTGAGIAGDDSRTAASNSWRENGVTNYTNRP
jgi:hypothetical protein